MSTPEGRVKAKLKRKVNERWGELFYWFMPVQMGMGAPALDVYGCYRGCFIAFETKAHERGITPRQQETSRQIDTAGGLVFVVSPKTDIDAILELIEERCL